MTGFYFIASFTLFGVFVLFLVASRTLNNCINLLIKLEYLMQKEHDLKLEALEVRKLMEEQMQSSEQKKEE
jgi:sensor histidine kinase YesM